MRSAAGQRWAGPADAFRWRGVIPLLALALTGCIADGQTTGSLVSGRNASIAFESIDGPPQPVFQKLVENLAAEAVARQVSVISREATPSYRVRGYMAAHLEGGRTHIGWVWDVYDANKRRVLRIASEEPAGRRHGDAWTADDDAMLRRIARTSMDRLAVFLDGGNRTPLPPADSEGMAVAGVDRDAAEPQVVPAAAAAVPARTPARRPARSAYAPGLDAALALADTRD
jgi:hypothetical protein